MFDQLFATMHEILDDIIREYDSADGEYKAALNEQLDVLKAMSDNCMEQWLKFVEKLDAWTAGNGANAGGHWQPAVPAPVSVPALSSDAPVVQLFSKGQGYFKLHMFDRAIREFDRLVQLDPECLLGRLYLAMAHLRQGHFGEASRHFHLVLPLLDDLRLKAIVYYALGHIHIQINNTEKAFEYVKLGLQADPSAIEAFAAPDLGSRIH